MVYTSVVHGQFSSCMIDRLGSISSILLVRLGCNVGPSGEQSDVGLGEVVVEAEAGGVCEGSQGCKLWEPIEYE